MPDTVTLQAVKAMLGLIITVGRDNIIIICRTYLYCKCVFRDIVKYKLLSWNSY